LLSNEQNLNRQEKQQWGTWYTGDTFPYLPERFLPLQKKADSSCRLFLHTLFALSLFIEVGGCFCLLITQDIVDVQVDEVESVRIDGILLEPHEFHARHEE